MSKIEEGTDNERALAAIGALRAYAVGDDELVASYYDTFTYGYLEYGILGFGVALLSTTESPEETLKEFSQAMFKGSELAGKIFAAASIVVAGGVYPVRREQAHEDLLWPLLLKTNLAFVGVFAREQRLTLEATLDHFQREILKRSE